MGRAQAAASLIIVLILVSLGGSSVSHGQTTSCPPSCQEIVPVIPTQGAASVQADPQPPVFGGDAGMYVSNKGSDSVSVVSGGLSVGNVPVGPSPIQGAYDPYGGLFYVPDTGAAELSVLAGASLDATIQLPASPLTPAFDPLNGYIYVPDNGGCDVGGGGACGTTVTVISGLKVIANVTVGTAPMEPVVDTNVNSRFYGLVYVPNAVSQDISVISGKNNTVVATLGAGPTSPILVPRPPGGGVYAPQDDTIYMGSYVVQGLTVAGQLPTLSLTSQSLNGNTPQFQVSCTASCVYNPDNGLVYEPSDPYQPNVQGFTLINGTSAEWFSCACGTGAVYNPTNGWVYAGAPVISGDTTFALTAPISGAYVGAQSYDASEGFVYGAAGTEAVRLGNFCPQVGGQYNYSALDLSLCNRGGSAVTAVTATMTATNSLNGGGSHIFSIVTAGNIPMASGNWTAQGSQIVGQSGGATISFSLTGKSGTAGTATIKVLKAEVVFLLALSALGGSSGLPTSRSIASWQPQLYIDGQQVTDTSITQDSTYVYVTFPIHFSTHEVAMKWTPSADAAGTSQTASSTTTTTSPSSTTSTTTSSATSAVTSTGSSSAVSPAYAIVSLASLGVIVSAYVLDSHLRRARRVRVRQ